jgi:hypothetical protein
MPDDDTRRPLVLLLLLGLLMSLSVSTSLRASAAPATPRPVEGYASYDPQSTCSPKPKPGTQVLAAWLAATYRGTSAPLPLRSCKGSTSEHKEGRALDWVLDAARKADRQRAKSFLDTVFATDADGNPHAIARRMGIMYVIWDDHLYASYRAFAPRAYLASSCKRVQTCSKTLRHRDHMHISLSRAGGRGETSWYDGRLG